MNELTTDGTDKQEVNTQDNYPNETVAMATATSVVTGSQNLITIVIANDNQHTTSADSITSDSDYMYRCPIRTIFYCVVVHSAIDNKYIPSRSYDTDEGSLATHLLITEISHVGQSWAQTVCVTTSTPQHLNTSTACAQKAFRAVFISYSKNRRTLTSTHTIH